MSVKTKRSLFKRSKKKAPHDLPSAWSLLGNAYKTLIDNWKIFGAITLIYGALFTLLARADGAADVGETQQLVEDLLGPETSEAFQTFTVAGALLSSAGAGGEAGQSIYGTLLIIVFSLINIWVLRRIAAGKKFKLRDAFYRSQTALIPFLLMLLLILVQLLPFALGGLLYATVEANNIAVAGWETALFAAIWVGLSLLSGRWLSNSLMAAYAVTLPGMYPIATLKATGAAVKGKRWPIMRKIIFLAAIAGSLFFLVFLFSIALEFYWLTTWTRDLYLVIILPFIHAYLYQLYRSLI